MQESIKWTYMGGGSSQRAYINQEDTLVFRFYPIVDEHKYPFEDLERAVKIWNKINSKLKPPAQISEQIITDIVSEGDDPNVNGRVKGWLSPKVHGRPATDEERRRLVLDLVESDGRYFMDATNQGNCITQENGDTVCIDVDLLLKLDQEEEELLLSRLHGTSFASFETWSSLPLRNELVQSNLFGEKAQEFPITAQTLKALLFIKSVRPDICNFDFLYDDITLDLMSNAYEQSLSLQPSVDIINLAQDLLEQERPPQLSSLKRICDNLFKQYLSSDTTIADSNQITCQEVMHYIQDASTAEEIVQSIEILRSKIMTKSDYFDLNRVLGKCLIASDALYQVNNRKSLIYIALFFAKYIYNRDNISKAILIHTIDLATINAKILLPIFFLSMFDQDPNVTQFLFLVMIVLSLPILTEFKNKLLSDMNLGIVRDFTANLLKLDLSTHNVKIFKQVCTPEYAKQISFLITGTYGELLPAYAALIGFGIAIAFQDNLIGGFAITGSLLYSAYMYYFLNPKYAKSYRINLAEHQILHKKLLTFIEKKDFIKFYGQIEQEEKDITRIMENVIPSTKKRSYYDAQTKIFGMLMGELIFLIGSIYVISTYQQSEKNIIDYILIYYYLGIFLMILNQLSSLMSQLLSSAVYTKQLVQYSMWSGGQVQKTYKKMYPQRLGLILKEQEDNSNKALLWQLSDINFRNVSYKSHNSEHILAGINLHIASGSFVALVGEEYGDQYIFSRLLRRNATPLAGQIMFNQMDSNVLCNETLYSLLCIIDSKDEFVKNLSWFETIKYGNQMANEEQVSQAAYATGLLEACEDVNVLKTRFISVEMTPIEKRRLAIARAILKGGQCLILDNPTAGLTYDEEIDILGVLIKLSSQIMTIMITDKLYLLDNFIDKIYYIENGNIQERGSYHALKESKGYFYKKLCAQRDGLRKLFSPPEWFSTEIDSQGSIILSNYRQVGYTSHEVEHTEENETDKLLVGDSRKTLVMV